MASLDLRIDYRYRLDSKLGAGGYGVVYQGLDVLTGDKVAIKLECDYPRASSLENEKIFYAILGNAPGIPRLFWSGYECEYKVIVFELLGPNLEELFRYCGRRFTLKTVLMIADQLIKRFQYIHIKCMIHRDVKPENLLLGTGIDGNTIYVSDFGLSKPVSAREEIPPRPGQNKPTIIGTPCYASINAHCGKELSFRDDMEALGYVLIYFLRGTLPWEAIDPKGGDLEKITEQLLKQKRSIKIPELCKGLPREFAMYFNHVRSLQFNEWPDYLYLVKIFENLFRRNSLNYDNIFDWTILRFFEMKKRSEKQIEQ